MYEDRTQKYHPKAHEKHPMHGMPYLTEDKSPVSEGEKHHVKDEDKTDECHKSQLSLIWGLLIILYKIKKNF